MRRRARLRGFFGCRSCEHGLKLEQVELADGTVLDLAQIEQDVQTVTGTDERNTLRGFETDDVLYGLGDNDTLYGNAGDDVLDGGAGNDSLSGQAGNDVYRWGPGKGNDTINDYDSTDRSDPDHVDSLVLSDDISIEDLWFGRSGNHLQISAAGTDEQLTITNWYSNEAYQVERIEVGSSVLLNNQVDQLVSAMAAYDAPSSAGNVIPQDVKDELQTVLTETWQPIQN